MLRTVIRALSRMLVCLVLAASLATGLAASDAQASHLFAAFPLEPPDTSSPRATLQSFLDHSGAFDKAMREEPENPVMVREARQRAERCFDLSEVAPTIQGSVALESLLRLREILDRIPLPDMEAVPDGDDMKRQNITLWRIPHTEIMIGRVAEGERVGSYLFTPQTVDRLDEFYAEVRALPYRDGAAQGIYEEYIYSSGWMIPDGFIAMLPGWMRQGYLGQAVWQWGGLGLVFLLSGLLLWRLLQWHRDWKKRPSDHPWRVSRLVFPFVAMGVCLLDAYILNAQINITGRVLSATTMLLEAALAAFAVWTILVAGNVITKGIIASQKIKEEALNADVIKLVGRLVSFGLAFALLYRVGGYFGLPVTAVFASAGIAGVAVALAARETLANFFGGVSIFLDRPFRAGDYILLDSGERGEVQAVGMRSTRLVTRDDIMITIPNSIITNSKIVNQSAPQPYLRVQIKIGVAYGSDLDKVETALMEAAKDNALLRKTPQPRARLRTFGDSSINYEFQVWVKRPHDRGRAVHELSREIYRRFTEQGIEIPFPQRDVHIKGEK
ncbi:MAG: mechanosensitive ion channel family protein [Pseudodesulfovibrio sp.]|uniref:MscS Mechanosensitive ion channel n=1 Tax=Pseudodesulfovibrio aespoeensis (strain ATCC 700646 / DSM 10631 / Aspo-2) TaxID=643562 RepID=E6VSD5_PSEA9|nr:MULTISPECIES: mechanosensitive ion channel family protein [Pseudodesulfovibrio]MBU4192293.1 mechanosensitive ion channel family protein [Pseudomonadota bacterium]ADU64278.1 MscS Mechanosensitive ion channel [Pseudodesulfovibrio aespoeensis Aspo-2]MBU4243684.1 mechanosensitive ion channel family protein [Pseudomonadota bacterium]MBU4378410.1 mechanosensitive ion channel family protein [Pseudomonadota bacterium]MBU4475652.1 mechanosensitive ion channel family protein [Pseudomonadota bacterium